MTPVKGQRVNNRSLQRTRPRNPESKSFKNELNVLQLIHAKRNISRIALSKETRLSAASITAIVQNLIDKGLVVESGHNSSALGRKPVSLRLRDDAGFLVGVDLGSFYTRVVVTDLRGTPVYKQESETGMSDGRDVVLSRTLKAIHKSMDRFQTPETDLKESELGIRG